MLFSKSKEITFGHIKTTIQFQVDQLLTLSFPIQLNLSYYQKLIN